MKPNSPLEAFALAAAACLVAALVSHASQATPPFASSSALAPRAAPNPPYVAISRNGANAAQLAWYHPDTSLTSYEVWRSEAPYFDPPAGSASQVGLYAFSEGIYGENAAFSFLDNGSCGYFVAAGQQLPCAPQNPPATVVGDPGHQYYWFVRASNGEYADSNRVGEFDFALVKGA